MRSLVVVQSAYKRPLTNLRFVDIAAIDG